MHESEIKITLFDGPKPLDCVFEVMSSVETLPRYPFDEN